MEVRKVSKERDEYCVKWENTDGVNGDWYTSAKKVVEETCGLHT